MLNQNTKKSPKKLWKTPSPSKPSLSGANLQFADLEANTLEELSIEELSSVSGGDGGQGIKILGEFRLEAFQIENLTNQIIPKSPVSLNLNGLQSNAAEVVGSSSPAPSLLMFGCSAYYVVDGRFVPLLPYDPCGITAL